jgi:Coenzyme PQQ synthesis protein D (PqqD)
MSVGKLGRIRPTKSVHVREFDGEMVLLDLERGEYFGLDELGGKVWRALVQGETPQEIAIHLEPEHDVSLETLVADLVALTDELVRRGLAEPL